MFGVLTLAVTQRSDLLVIASLLAPAFFTGTVGLVILLRSPNHRMGWLLIAIGFWGTLLGISGQYAELAFVRNPAGAYPLKWMSAWVANWGWFPYLGMVFMILAQIFPTGHPLPSRWKTVLQVTLIYLVLFTLLLAFGNVPLAVSDVMLPNPVGVIPINELVDTTVPEAIITALLLGSLIISWISLAVRYRRSRGNERQQMKWFAYTASIFDVFMAAIIAVDLGGHKIPDPWEAYLVTGLILFLVLGLAMAILQYRLYDIDLVINRTLVYGTLTALLGGIYVGGVIGLQATFRATTGEGGGDMAIVISTLAIAALFMPLRRRIQVLIERRFYRRRYNAARTVAAFSARMRDEVDVERLTGELVRVVEETIQPTHVSLWLRDHSRESQQELR